VEWLIFQRNCRFLSFFFPFRSFTLPVVSLERIIPRYELGIYNYTGAVIGFPSFFLLLFLPPSLFLSPSFFGNIAQFRVSLYIGKPINKSPAQPTEKFPIIHRDRLSVFGRCPARGKSESPSRYCFNRRNDRYAAARAK